MARSASDRFAWLLGLYVLWTPYFIHSKLVLGAEQEADVINLYGQADHTPEFSAPCAGVHQQSA